MQKYENFMHSHRILSIRLAGATGPAEPFNNESFF